MQQEVALKLDSLTFLLFLFLNSFVKVKDRTKVRKKEFVSKVEICTLLCLLLLILLSINKINIKAHIKVELQLVFVKQLSRSVVILPGFGLVKLKFEHFRLNWNFRKLESQLKWRLELQIVLQDLKTRN